MATKKATKTPTPTTKATPPKVCFTQAQVKQACNILGNVGINNPGLQSTRVKYYAYLVGMAIQPNTANMLTLQGNAVLPHLGIMGITVPSGNPNCHLGSGVVVRNYHAKHTLLGASKNVVQLACTTHTLKATNCGKACLYGLYVHGSKAFANTLLASGKGKAKATPQPTAPTKAQAKAKATPKATNPVTVTTLQPGTAAHTAAQQANAATVASKPQPQPIGGTSIAVAIQKAQTAKAGTK